MARLPGSASDDAGSGTVLALAVMAVVVVLAAGLGTLALAQGARGTARTGADLAALAAAGSLSLPVGLEPAPGSAADACALAAEVGRRNGAEITDCRVDGDVVTVAAERATALGVARAVARAGPASVRSRPP